MKNKIILILSLLSFMQCIIGQTATGTITQVPCNNDGIYTVTTTGLTLPLTFTYNIRGQIITHSNVNSTTDQLTNIKMTNHGYINCIVTGVNSTAYTSDNYTPSFTFSLSATSPVCPSTMGTVNAVQSTGTTGPFSFVWKNIQTLTTYTGSNAPAPLGDYSVEITDLSTGCILSDSDSTVNINQLSNVLGTINTTDAGCTNGTASVIGSGGIAPYSYLWVNGATTSTISGLNKGYFPVTITDAQGCQSTNLVANVLQSPIINVNSTVTNASCIQSDGSAMAFGSGGVSPYTYSWSNGQTSQSATSLSGQNYHRVIVTDAMGCTGESSIYIPVTTPINVSYTSISSLCTSATGSASLSIFGGTAPFTVVWDTAPSINNTTLSNLAPGTYSFQVTDAVGCIRSGSVLINSVSTISPSIYSTPVVCPSTNGSANVNVSGSNPPFTYLWNNGATTSQINGLSAGFYSCIITDTENCTRTKYVNVTDLSPINITVSTTPVTCVYNTDGSAISTVSGGVAPYTYEYTNGATTSSVSGLGVGNYYLTVTDANGCSATKFFHIENSNTSTSCYCTISGNVYVDVNADCNYDTGENGIENIMIHCSGYGYTYTDVNGYYSFQVPTGTYTISEQVNAYYPLASCQSNANVVNVVAASGCNTIVNIANNMNVIHDLKMVTVSANLPPIPGNVYRQKVIVINEGTSIESGIQLGYEHDSQIPLVSSNSSSLVLLNSIGAPYSYSVQSGFPSLSPNSTNVMLLNYNTPTNIPIGTVLNFDDTVAHLAPINTSWLLDQTPWNNVNAYQTTVIGSYDPNYKEVYPKGKEVEGYISSETKEFDYTIHFQNEGTYFAQNIYVTDQLDEDLDWTTLRPGYSDYDYTTTVSETGLVTFRFANINLPWKSFYGDAMSSGLINYSIKRKASNIQGTVFTNKADIFFDYNAPIETNTTINTLSDTFYGVEELGVIESEVTVDLYPVPAKDFVTIRLNSVLKNEEVTVTIIDLLGSVVLSNRIQIMEGTTVVNQDVSRLVTGTYLTRLQFDNGTTIIKKMILFKE